MTDLPGPISKVLGPAFNDLKGKMNVIYGLSVLHNYFSHQGTAASASSSQFPVETYLPGPRTRQPSMQYILSQSPQVYPDGDAGIVRHIGVSRAYAGGGLDFDAPDFTYDNKGRHMGYLSNAKSLYQKFAGSFKANVGTTTNPATDPITGPRIKMVQDIYQD